MVTATLALIPMRHYVFDSQPRARIERMRTHEARPVERNLNVMTNDDTKNAGRMRSKRTPHRQVE
jgi:hypothetical protein